MLRRQRRRQAGFRGHRLYGVIHAIAYGLALQSALPGLNLLETPPIDDIPPDQGLGFVHDQPIMSNVWEIGLADWSKQVTRAGMDRSLPREANAVEGEPGRVELLASVRKHLGLGPKAQDNSTLEPLHRLGR